MTKAEIPGSNSELTFARLVNLAKVTYFRLLPQPNRKFTLSLLLDQADIPGPDWLRARQQSLKYSAIDKSDPINVRAAGIESTFARRSFKNYLTNDVVTIEVTPLATIEDVETRLSTFEERFVSRASKLFHLSGYEVVDIEEWRCLEYRWGEESTRTARLVVTAFDKFLVGVSFLTFDEPWDWSEIISLAKTQVNKIHTLTKPESD